MAPFCLVWKRLGAWHSLCQKAGARDELKCWQCVIGADGVWGYWTLESVGCFCAGLPASFHDISVKDGWNQLDFGKVWVSGKALIFAPRREPLQRWAKACAKPRVVPPPMRISHDAAKL